jgi:hypothetical protein
MAVDHIKENQGGGTCKTNLLNFAVIQIHFFIHINTTSHMYLHNM